MNKKAEIISAALISLILIGLCKMWHDDVNKVEAPEAIVTEVTTTNVTTTCTTSCTTTMNTTEATTGVTTEITSESVTDPVTEVTEVVVEEEHYEEPVTEPVVETPAETQNIEEPQPEPEPIEEYLVYKPSTHYIHKNTCRWNSGDAYRVDDVTGLEARLCNECNPVCDGYTEYIPPEADKNSMTYVGNFTATYYPATAYYDGVCGGSGRTLLGYGDYGDGIRGSIASRSLWSTYGYNRNGRTTVYLEFPDYPEMSGTYYLDDCSAFCGIIDVFVWSSWSCPFGNAGVTSVDCYIE